MSISSGTNRHQPRTPPGQQRGAEASTQLPSGTPAGLRTSDSRRRKMQTGARTQEDRRWKPAAAWENDGSVKGEQANVLCHGQGSTRTRRGMAISTGSFQRPCKRVPPAQPCTQFSFQAGRGSRGGFFKTGALCSLRSAYSINQGNLPCMASNGFTLLLPGAPDLQRWCWSLRTYNPRLLVSPLVRT